jgi:DNA-binding GntR family transcriptional regulator
MTAETGERLPQTQRAYLEIRRRILDNEMPPNTQYLERELAAELKMSRTPVREALIRLRGEGLVEIRPRHGIRVLPISVKDMREIYELLTELETMAVRRLAERGLSRKDLARLDQAIAEMESALARDDLDAWARNDELFHSLLADLTGNLRLRQVLGMFRDHAHRARLQTLRLKPRPVESNRDHAAVVDAIRRGDSEAAAAIHHHHREQCSAKLLKVLTSLAERGIDRL